jgi:hypothetical protein
MRGSTAGRLAALAGFVCAGLSADAATLRKNEFFFSVPDLNQGFHFDLKQYEVTKGQPWEGVSTSIDTEKHYAWLYVMAGRKGSYDVGYWFRAQVGSGAALGVLAKARLPTDLNFAIRGDLTIKAGGMKLFCKDVVLGQGHSFPFNNWWVGGPNMKLENDNGRPMLVQHCEGGTMKTAIGGVGVNNFDLYVNGL